MKIVDKISSVKPVSQNEVRDGKQVAVKHQSEPANESVKISISADLPGEASKLAKGEQPFDVKKVDAIKRAIESGEYKIDAGKVADGMINAAKQFLTE